MQRSSKAITLVLLGSAFVIGGCSEDEDEEVAREQNQGAQGHGGRGIFIAPRIGGGMMGGGRGVGAAPSARGGFGGTGSVGVGS